MGGMADDTVWYEQDMDDDGEDSDGFWVDRRDRTSEAGTSGSESDEEEVDEEAQHFSDVRERMGEPSTSGREVGGVASNGMDSVRVINTVEVKEEMVEAKLASNELGAAGKVRRVQDLEQVCDREAGLVWGCCCGQ